MDAKISEGYRKDIDGLRAIAVLAVISFHLGYLPNGYLGVDVFFVISGYLITKIIYNESLKNRFSVRNFYLRRIRRIIPLVLFTTSIALMVGFFVMLPDDLENLSQSVVATNLFSNNILQLITTRNYWDTVNEYKPLMHTWSLGIEEQFYFIYPLLFLFLKGKRIRWILPVLIILTTISFLMFFSSSNEPSKFYSIQFRFFELSLGGIGAIIFNDQPINSRFKVIPISILLLLLLVEFNLPNNVKLSLVVIATLSILLLKSQYKWNSFILENKLMVNIGKISFSLYMWHQIVLAFSRYFIKEEFSIIDAVGYFIFVLLLSILSYLCIEQPFRDKKKVKTARLLFITSSAFAFTTAISLFVYMRSGVIRDVPELNITKSDIQRHIHKKYTDRIYNLDKDYTKSNKIKILVIGDSYARDWANILLESIYGSRIEISYIFYPDEVKKDSGWTFDIKSPKNVSERIRKSKYIFFSQMKKTHFNILAKKYYIDTSKIWCVGTKNFGLNNGIFYNRRGNKDYRLQRTKVKQVIIEKNEFLKKQWTYKYIDLIGMIADNKGTVPVFTPECKFISQDCEHLTQSGAKYFAQLLENSGTFAIK